ncbi:Alkaline/neutral invertase CINV1 [Raphanus sativus]|nr:Alkaline/neutral invertase CINV1 [Raphanus sativus]
MCSPINLPLFSFFTVRLRRRIIKLTRPSDDFFSLSSPAGVLLWQLTATCIKTGRPQIARRAVDLIESRLHRDCWPEYYDGKLGRYVGKQARKYQTWSIAGYLVAKMLLEDPSHIGMISLEEDKLMKPVIKRSASWPQL